MDIVEAAPTTVSDDLQLEIVCGFNELVLVGLCSVICTLMGFAITKADIFPLVAARGAGQVLLVSISSLRSQAILTSAARTLPSHRSCFPKLSLLSIPTTSAH